MVFVCLVFVCHTLRAPIAVNVSKIANVIPVFKKEIKQE